MSTPSTARVMAQRSLLVLDEVRIVHGPTTAVWSSKCPSGGSGGCGDRSGLCRTEPCPSAFVRGRGCGNGTSFDPVAVDGVDASGTIEFLLRDCSDLSE